MRIVLTNGAVPPMIIAGVHRYPDQSDAEHEPQSQRQSQVLGIPVGVPLAVVGLLAQLSGEPDLVAV